jgi:hypothetical protein
MIRTTCSLLIFAEARASRLKRSMASRVAPWCAVITLRASCSPVSVCSTE